MEFNYWDLGQQLAGVIVQVTLGGNSANVRLFDSANYSAFKAGRSARGYGGHATRSPVRLQIPSSLVCSCRLRRPARSWPGGVFISHASEDKDEVVRPLAHELQQRGLRVWFDEFELRIGDSLRRKIDQGIARSAFGVVVLSPEFFAKNWTQYELDGLVTRSIDGSQVLLPLGHRLTKAEVMSYSPSLADKLARSTGTSTLEEIAAEIAEVVSTATGTAALPT